MRPNHQDDNQSIKGQNDREDECIDTNNARPIDNIVQAEETSYSDIEVRYRMVTLNILIFYK